MVPDTNVWANVKAILDIAIVTIKIHAPVVPPVHLARLVPMEITVVMARKVKLEHKVLVKDTNVHQRPADVKNAQTDPKDPPDLLDPLDLLARKVVPVAKEAMAKPAALAQLVVKVKLVRLVQLVNLVLMVNLAKTPKAAPRDLPEAKVKKEELAQLVLLAKKEPQAKQALLVPLVHPAVLAKEAKMEEKETLAHPAQLENPARMPNTVHAPIVPRKHKQLQHRINPNTILGYHGFDNNDNEHFLNNLKLIVPMIIFPL